MQRRLIGDLKKIPAFDNDEAMARQIWWINQHGERNAFLEKLNKQLDADGLEKGTKTRSRIYSSSVVEYDKENSQQKRW